MTLATRCAACGTSFRVVQDQLKVSGGWVRCGRCNEVFNAIEGLYEIGSPLAEAAPDTLSPGPSAESVESPLESTTAPADTRQHESAPPTEVSAWPGLDDVWVTPAADPAFSQDPAVQARLAHDDIYAGEHEDTASGAETLAPQSSAAGPARPRVEPAAEPPASARSNTLLAEPPRADAEPALASIEPMPSFVRAAQRAERWQRPPVRLALGVCSFLLVALLATQAAVAYRSIVASRWPASRTLLDGYCAWIGCTVGPMRHIAALSVESSGLQQVGGTTIFNLSVVLRNHSDAELMAPALDVALSDAQGHLVARRVLTLAELGHPAPTLVAGAEVSLQAGLNTGDTRVAGYTIDVFYP